jgi:HSP20 family protein
MDRTTDPFDDLERLFDRMSRQFGGLEHQLGTATVSVDVRETPEAFVLTADVPGVEPDDIDLQVSDGRRVEISAEREEAVETDESDETGHFVTRERHLETFERTVTLPEPVDEAAAEASYDAGVLTVTLPKRTVDEDGTDIPVS